MPKYYKWKLVHSIGGYRVMYWSLSDWIKSKIGKEDGNWRWYVDNLCMEDIVLADWIVQEIEKELVDKVCSMNATWPDNMGSNTLESWLHYLVTKHIYE